MAVTARPDALPRSATPALLRRLRRADLPAFHAYRSNAELARFQAWTPMTRPEALAFIDEMAAAPLFAPGEWVQIAIADAAGDLLVGDLGVFVASAGDMAELGFTLAPSAQGKGYAAAAVRAAVDHLFAQTAVERIVGITDARNAASVRVLERAGMTRIESRQTVFKGEPCTEWVYALRRPATPPVGPYGVTIGK